MNTTNHAAENRRIQLRKWIHDHFGGSQSLFISSTNDGEKQIYQGELSGLLGKKSFGEKRARRLEQQAKMPTNYLEEVTQPARSMVSEPHQDEPRRENPTTWPVTRVSLGRLVELKRALGGHKGVEAMHDIDETLEITVMKWERRATAKKRTAA